MAVVLDEAETERILSKLATLERKLMAAPTYVELMAVANSRLDADGRRLMERLLREAKVTIVEFAETSRNSSSRLPRLRQGDRTPGGAKLG